MFFRDRKQDIFTIPNALSLFRLILIPIYVSIYSKAESSAQFFTAGVIISVSCLTDALDGIIARHFNMISTLGKILDPLADKITQFAITICLSFQYSALKPVLLLFTVKELFQLVLGIIYLMHGKMLPGALPAGKISTAVFFVSLILMVLFPNLPARTITFVALTDSVFLIFSFLCYIQAYLGSNAMLKDLHSE